MGIFSGRHALVVGGSGGIGRAVALGLAERDARLTIHGGVSPERLERMLTAIPGASGFLCAVGEPGGLPVEEAAAEILRRAAGNGAGPGEAPDILVCAWGPFARNSLLGDENNEKNLGIWRNLTENNLIFPEILVSGVINSMINKGFGRILLFGGTGTAHIRGFTATIAYSAAKTALGVVAKSAARAGKRAGVTCNVVCPGLADTEYTGKMERDYNLRHSPGGKAIEVEDIARAALAVLENPGINGAVIPVDCGIFV